jgi:signal transduction histidine kinase
VEELRQIALEKPPHITLEESLPCPGPVVRSNSHEIHQMLGCLLTNAWEACAPDRATVRISVRACGAAEIPAANRFPVSFAPVAAGYGCIEVSDTGSGIPEQAISQVFDPFYSTKFAGRGLGLSVVLGIVRAHEGVVTVESEQGRGSTFRIFLPQAVRQG